jgi:hypothetical protein
MPRDRARRAMNRKRLGGRARGECHEKRWGGQKSNRQGSKVLAYAGARVGPSQTVR